MTRASEPGERSVTTATNFWAAHFGCPGETLFASPLRVVPHGAALAGYDGIFALFSGAASVISFPPDRLAPLRARLPSAPLTPLRFAEAFSGAPYTVIGPASIAYAEAVVSPAHPVRPATAKEIAALRVACTSAEWEHGGSPAGFGVFAGSRLAALAGYETWGGTLAHLSVVTHREFRGRGFGRSAVAHAARAALAAGLLPQYRTLESNLPSMRVAASLGFRSFATSVAVRLNRG